MRIDEHLIINCPVEEVYSFMVDFENDIYWWPQVLKSKRTSAVERGVGASYWQRVQLMGKKFEVTFEVIEAELNRELSFKTTSGPLPFTCLYVFEPVESGTSLTVTNIVHTKGWLFKLLEPILMRVLKSVDAANYGSLKKYLETRAEVEH